MIRFTVLIVLCTACLWAMNNPADAHFDIFVTNLGGKTGIGGADVDTGVFDVNTRVFEGVMIAASSPDYTRDEPGFFALSHLAPSDLFPNGASALAPNALVSMNIQSFSLNNNVSSLFYWNGTGEVNFQPAAGASFLLADPDAFTGGNGELDFHPDYEINDSVSTPTNGVYLASLTATAAGLNSSDPIYFVWLVDFSITNDFIAEDIEGQIEAGTAFPFFEDALGWVESNVVPEPASLTAAVGGLLILAMALRPCR
jgi:hypothetical protein